MKFHFRFPLVLFWIGALALGQDPYEVLGVSPSASEDEILKAYRRQVKATHPDVSALPSHQAQEAFKRIQTAWEQIKEHRTVRAPERTSSPDYERRQQQERTEAQKRAKAILDQDWSQGIFGISTFSKLPQLNASKKPRGKFVPVAHGPKDEGEWNAIREFLSENVKDFLGQRPTAEQVDLILKELDLYSELTGQASKDIRAGMTTSLESYVLENAVDRGFFLDSLKERIDRLNRAGAFVLSSSPVEERRQVLGKAVALFSERFPMDPGTGESPTFHLAKQLMDHLMAQVQQSPLRVHELNTLIRGVAPVLGPEERLVFLGKFLEHLDTLPPQLRKGSGVSDIQKRVESQIARVFEAQPELRNFYAGKASLWNRLTSQSKPCEIMLGKLAKKRR